MNDSVSIPLSQGELQTPLFQGSMITPAVPKKIFEPKSDDLVITGYESSNLSSIEGIPTCTCTESSKSKPHTSVVLHREDMELLERCYLCDQYHNHDAPKITLFNCSHMFCQQGLMKFLIESMHKKHDFDIVCPQCSAKLNDFKAQLFLNSKIYERFELTDFSSQVDTADKPEQKIQVEEKEISRYCIKCKEILLEIDGENYWECQNCSLKFCSNCDGVILEKHIEIEKNMESEYCEGEKIKDYAQCVGNNVKIILEIILKLIGILLCLPVMSGFIFVVLVVFILVSPYLLCAIAREIAAGYYEARQARGMENLEDLEISLLD